MTVVRFEDVVKRVNIKVDRNNTDRKYYCGGEHIESDEFMTHSKGLIKGSTIGFKFHYGFNPGHILFVSRNPHLRKCSMVNYYGVCSDSTYVIETKDENVLMQKYLLLELQSDRFWKWAEEHKSGGVNYLINYATLNTYEFSLPPLSEQKVLADKLWAAYRLKESYKKLLQATDDMVKAKFEEDFIKKFKPSILGDFISVTRGVTYKKTDLRTKDDDATPILRSNNIVNGEIKLKELLYVNSSKVNKEQYLRDGDLVMCGSNGSKDLVGKAGIIKKDVSKNAISFGAFCLGIRCKDSLYPEYLNVFFKTKTYRKIIESLGNGTNIINIRPDHIKSLLVPIPKKETQESFVKIVNRAESTKSSLRSSISSIDKVIKSLING